MIAATVASSSSVAPCNADESPLIASVRARRNAISARVLSRVSRDCRLRSTCSSTSRSRAVRLLCAFSTAAKSRGSSPITPGTFASSSPTEFIRYMSTLVIRRASERLASLTARSHARACRAALFGLEAPAILRTVFSLTPNSRATCDALAVSSYRATSAARSSGVRCFAIVRFARPASDVAHALEVVSVRPASAQQIATLPLSE